MCESGVCVRVDACMCMCMCICVCTSERRAEGVDVRQRAGVRLHVELARYGQAASSRIAKRLELEIG